MAIAGKEVVAEGTEGAFHCVSRCMRRAFLCGEGPYSGRSFEHRRGWIRSRLETLARYFAMEVCGYAVMSNHVHLVLRTRPDWVKAWDDRKIAERWLSLFPKAAPKMETGDPKEPPAKAFSRNKRKLYEINKRLSSLSWFMRCLNDYVARRANREDGCKGRFWEGRFRCQALLDEAASLACMAYVDLNPIRANMAQTPEESLFTCAFERIKGRKSLAETNHKPLELNFLLGKPGEWLCPIGEEHGKDREGLLSLSLDEYLEVLDWTGRQLVLGKKGTIPDELQPIQTRIEINPDHWHKTVKHFGRKFKLAAGRFWNPWPKRPNAPVVRGSRGLNSVRKLIHFRSPFKNQKNRLPRGLEHALGETLAFYLFKVHDLPLIMTFSIIENQPICRKGHG